MVIFPAIDMIAGRVVRLTRGDYGSVSEYALTPAEAARNFYAGGARHLHAVDLDGAKSGRAENAAAVGEIVRAAKLFVEVGGGIRTEAQIERYLAAGVGRVILGTAAVRDPAFTRRAAKNYPGRIAVGVDAREGKVAVSGWTEDSGRDAFDFCRELADAGVEYVIYTDISRDGLLAGANLAAYEKLSAVGGLKITASGGITGAAEISALRDMGVYAAIVGKALYENKLTLAEALAAAGESDAC